ncbi:hypothetical protein P3X46_033464 [Hevea brasiliensis]|uniref:Stigma-specific STIG1-like protein 1 n=1 Tax=Hevea brasiliensis TaxID=3981 RepID=A0ABQ9KHT3_HEVBR|nr:stigma-specific STIG1-like protein 1 [Hevea brasiliensis]KAJ9136379.1 hypothetical protein P3X46_033464 [Hevea brasiliensis]
MEAMKSSKILFSLLGLLMAIGNILYATPTSENLLVNIENSTTNELPSPARSLEPGRFLASKPPPAMTCDKYPRVCRAKGSAGPDCCKKQCVDVMKDKLNCGKCGKKCKYSEICCQGRCVNPSNDEKNCGKCNNRCKKGSSCVYGLCSYA